MNPALSSLTFSLERALSLSTSLASTTCPDDLLVLHACLKDLQQQINSFLHYQEREATPSNHHHQQWQYQLQQTLKFLHPQQLDSAQVAMVQQEQHLEKGESMDENGLHQDKRARLLGTSSEPEYDFNLMRKQVKAAEQRHKLDLIFQFRG